ncbi:HugZ family protein [Sphaerotilus sp.]|uniref:HugZ family pyridoxamine 5'-phosphate oxidase n=1 Tax=Sphaerotilus sp. TaxID=2093942 RepID=UPI002ACE5399|nr:pyridoxamine 5'-phosphate oxidase family protein [Sphaerotilus sp.]MDZ7855720.1 pyridoxamine 5'-phosphate oxidase family protein [Sphaerotilus sp.]
MSHLDRSLLDLLHRRRTAALGTRTVEGEPALSIVPYAIDPASGVFVLLISGLAAHTRQLQDHPRASLLVCDSEDQADNVHALARVSLDVEADWPIVDSGDAQAASATYLARHPAAELLTQLPDFRWVRLRPLQARHVAGFGAARTLDQTRLSALIRNNPDQRR